MAAHSAYIPELIISFSFGKNGTDMRSERLKRHSYCNKKGGFRRLFSMVGFESGAAQGDQHVPDVAVFPAYGFKYLLCKQVLPL